MNKTEDLKLFLKSVGALYISNEKRKEIEYIYLTYLDENFTISINDQYKLIIINTEPSLFEETDIYPDELNGKIRNEEHIDGIDMLMSLLKKYIPYTEFNNHNLISFKHINGKNKKIISILSVNTKELTSLDYIIDEEDPCIKSDLIEIKEGLDNFDSKIFKENWLEDFNIKVSKYKEKDLYILILTLRGYLYKLIKNTWNDENIDPYVIDNILSRAIVESKKYNCDFSEWFLNWNNYFTEDKIKKYLKKR